MNMLAKVLAKDGVRSPLSVNWPIAGNADASADVFAPAAPSLPAEAEQLRAPAADDLSSAIARLERELAAAKAEALQLSQDAFAAGKREGDTAARRDMEQQVEGELAKIRQLLREGMAIGPKLRHQAEADLVKLAISIARRILHREITVDAQATVGLVKAAFARANGRELHQVRTDPASLPVVQRILEGMGSPASVKIVADLTLRPGSLIFETPQGQLDASVDTQLDEIGRGFADVVTHS